MIRVILNIVLINFITVGFVDSVYVSESLFYRKHDEELFIPARKYNRNHVVSKTWKPKSPTANRQKRLIDANFERSFAPTASISRVHSPTRTMNRSW